MNDETSHHQAIRRKVLLYFDDGVATNGLHQCLCTLEQTLNLKQYKCEIVSADYLKNIDDWESTTDLIIIPGGRSLPYYSALGEKGNQRIRRYVENGGNYLGICAGSYYGAAHTVFEKNGPLEVMVHGPLNFYEGTAEGPAYGLGVFSYHGTSGVRQARIQTDFDQSTTPFLNQYTVHFDGGPYFHDKKNRHAIVLARYADIENTPPAIIECHVQKGKAILMGVHVEYQFKSKSLNEARLFLFTQLMKRFNLQMQPILQS